MCLLCARLMWSWTGLTNPNTHHMSNQHGTNYKSDSLYLIPLYEIGILSAVKWLRKEVISPHVSQIINFTLRFLWFRLLADLNCRPKPDFFVLSQKNKAKWNTAISLPIHFTPTCKFLICIKFPTCRLTLSSNICLDWKETKYTKKWVRYMGHCSESSGFITVLLLKLGI